MIEAYSDEELVEEVHAPNGGLMDTVNLDLLRGSQASAMTNMHHDRLALDRRLGRVQMGSPTPDLTCYGGFHYRKNDGEWQIVRVNGVNLYRWTGSAWVGAVSLLAAAHSPDVIGSASGLGTWVQYGDRLYWYDGGTVRKYWDGSALHTYGIFAGVDIPAGTASAKSGTTTGSFSFNGATTVQASGTGITGTATTLAAWVKTTARGGVITLRAVSATDINLALEVENSFLNDDVGGLWTRSPYAASWVNGSNTNDGNWHHLAMVRNGTARELYADGALVDNTPTAATGTALAAVLVYLGSRYRYVDTDASDYFTGLIDDARVYARALSAGEIGTLYAGGDPDPTGLVGHWKFDEGTGANVGDSSSQSNLGVVSGTATWSSDRPSQMPAGAGSGDLLAGDYSFVYTYYNPTTGEESNPSDPSNVITFAQAGGALSATVPANSAWVSSFSTIRFYRTVVNGGTYFFDHEVSGVVGLPITETLSKADELLGDEAQFTRGAIPRIKYAILFDETVIGAGNPDSPSTLYWSAPADPTHWPPQNSQDIDRDNGDPITGLFRLLGRLYVIKQTSGVYMLTPRFGTDGSVSFSVEAVTSDFGSLSHHAITVIGTLAYWPDAKGICRFNGQQPDPISDAHVRQRWKTLATGTNATRCVAVHDRQPDHQYYRLTIEDPTDSKAYDLIFDTSTESWFQDVAPSATTGWTSRVSWAVKLTNAQYVVLQADNTGRCFRLRTDLGNNPVYAEAGEALVSTWKSRSWGGIDGVLPMYVDIEYERSAREKTTGPVTVSLYVDGQTTAVVTDTTSVVLYDETAAAPTDSTQPDPTKISHCVRINFDGNWCRRFQFGVDCSSTKADLKILQYRIGYRRRGAMMKAG